MLILLFQLMKAVMEDEEIVDGFKMGMDRVSSYLQLLQKQTYC